jgi:hypothetical protein
MTISDYFSQQPFFLPLPLPLFLGFIGIGLVPMSHFQRMYLMSLILQAKK